MHLQLETFSQRKIWFQFHAHTEFFPFEVGYTQIVDCCSPKLEITAQNSQKKNTWRQLNIIESARANGVNFVGLQNPQLAFFT